MFSIVFIQNAKTFLPKHTSKNEIDLVQFSMGLIKLVCFKYQIINVREVVIFLYPKSGQKCHF